MVTERPILHTTVIVVLSMWRRGAEHARHVAVLLFLPALEAHQRRAAQAMPWHARRTNDGGAGLLPKRCLALSLVHYFSDDDGVLA